VAQTHIYVLSYSLELFAIQIHPFRYLRRGA